jgi:hypothetical protein
MAARLICSDCREEYTMTASEKVRFQELIKNVQGFVMPKRCPACRKKNREAKALQGSSPQVSKTAVFQAVVAAPPAPRVMVETPKNGMPAVKVETVGVEIPKEEIRLILATKDFEDLVHGRPVIWQGVRVILADIGFKVMRDAIERAETERAKVLFHKNGSN